MSKARSILTISQNIRLGTTVVLFAGTLGVMSSINGVRDELHAVTRLLEFGKVTVRTDHYQPLGVQTEIKLKD